MANTTRRSVEYEATVTVCEQQGGAERQRRRSVAIQLAVETTQSPSTRTLHVRLTDEADPFFLYTLAVSEGDFAGLKAAQDLKVGFDAFPSNLRQLLQRCAAEAASPQPKYLVQLETSTGAAGRTAAPAVLPAAKLNIVETNDFKNLTHLALSLVPGNDSAVKTHLASCMRALKAENEDLRQRAAETTSSQQGRIDGLTAELERCQADLRQCQGQLTVLQDVETARHNTALAEQQQEAAAALAAVRGSMAQENRAQAQRDAAQVTAATERARELAEANARLTDAKYALEGSLRETQIRLSSAEASLDRVQGERDRLEAERSALNSGKGVVEKTLNEANVRMAQLTQQLESKDSALTQEAELVQASQRLQQQLTQQLDEYKRHSEASQHAVKASAQDVVKANSIIAKLQQELSGMQAKVSLRDQLAVKQEQALVECQAGLQQAQDELQQARQRLAAQEQAAEARGKELAQLQVDFEERGQLLKNSESIITWLNKQLTEASIRPEPRAPFKPSGTTDILSKARSPFGTSMENALNRGKAVAFSPGSKTAPTSSPATSEGLAAKYLSPEGQSPLSRLSYTAAQQPDRASPSTSPMPTRSKLPKPVQTGKQHTPPTKGPVSATMSEPRTAYSELQGTS